ncbi:MAG: efflux RND transporter periplasmic adaptor subunit [Acidobacteriota bacterium]
MSRTGRLLIVVGLCGVAAACKGDGGNGNGARSGGPRPLPVRVAPIAARDVVYRVKSLGSLEADEVVQITAEVTGAVSEVRFHPGDHVTPATVLARIDPERYRLEAARADATYRRAVADWRRADAEAARREALAKDQLVSDEELTRARLEAERLAADAAGAKAAFDIAAQNLARSEVRAPRAGVIDTRSIDTGQFVQVGKVIATLVDLDRLRLRFKVSDAESLKIQNGQTVTFAVASLAGTEFAATVYHVGEIADPATRQVEVLGWVKNPGALKPGFFAEVTLAIEAHRNALVVPEGAVQASERGFVAYVVEGGRAHERPIRLGLRTGEGLVEIVSGLTAGETVVIEGSDRLADNMLVQPVTPVPATATTTGQP